MQYEVVEDSVDMGTDTEVDKEGFVCMILFCQPPRRTRSKVVFEALGLMRGFLHRALNRKHRQLVAHGIDTAMKQDVLVPDTLNECRMESCYVSEMIEQEPDSSSTQLQVEEPRQVVNNFRRH